MSVQENSQDARWAARFLPGVAGFSAIVGQIVLLRELIVLANGNELSLGVMLAAWLAWNAAGSSLAGWFCRGQPRVRESAILALACAGLSLPATIAAIRLSRTLFTEAPTELLSPGATLVLCLLCLSVFCGLSGSLFSFAAQLYRQSSGVAQGRALGYAYLLETAGTAAGGILTSLLLLRRLESFQIAFLICTLDLCVAGAVLPAVRRRGRAAIGIALGAAGHLAAAYVAPGVERASQQRQWSPLRVIASRDSIYGRITVTEAGGMRAIYEDGSILANVPDQAAAEEAVHYALLEHPLPKRVLLIGSSQNGSVVEALKYRFIEQLDLVELDPAISLLFHRLFPEESKRAFSDVRAHSHFGDGRHYLQGARAKFDVIIVNVPDPETALWNRFFTLEFFRLARGRLAPGGILALQLHSSEEFISAEQAEFLRSIRATLGEAFPRVTLIPGDPIHMLAAVDQDLLTDDPQVLISRLRSRNISTQYVSEYLLPFRMSGERLAYVKETLAPVPATPINRDFHPVAFYFNETVWSAQFRSSYGILLRKAAAVPFRFVLGLGGGMLITVLVLVLRLSRRRTGPAVGWSVFAGGYELMTLQILLLLAFQSVYGYLYHAMAMLIGMLMAGIALGSWLGMRRLGDPGARLVRLAAGNQWIMAASAPLLMMAVVLLARGPEELARMAFPAIALLSGIPGGLQFSIAAELYTRDSRNSAHLSSGSLYAIDLLGGCAGALFIAGFLVPVYGLWNTAWLAGLIGIAPAILLVRIATTSMRSTGVLQTLRP